MVWDGVERRMGASPQWRVVIPLLVAITGFTSWGTVLLTSGRYNGQATRAFNANCQLTRQSRPISNKRNVALAEFIDTRADSELRNLQLLRATIGQHMTAAQFERLSLVDAAGRRKDITAARETAKQFRVIFPAPNCADVLAGKAPPPPLQLTRSTP